MKYPGLIVIALAILFVAPRADARCDRKCESEKNKAAATAYCAQYQADHPDKECKVEKRVCSKGYVAAKKWKGQGTNYSACVKGKKATKIKAKVKQIVFSTTAKVNLYKAYFKRVDKHAKERQPLPEWFIRRYSKFFKLNLRGVRIHESSKVNGNNAMADCKNIYFPVGKLSTVLLESGNRRWLLHEVTHSEQCHEKGSREAYARLWWRDQHLGVLKAMAGGDGVKSDEVHDKNPMEAKAEAKAEKLKNAP
ncbi:MAG TPA: hypothetical protein PKA88_16560 [Polyangiaceae bacterium]|nr:hypothetical protein [Polyangiaceae bacterium]